MSKSEDELFLSSVVPYRIMIVCRGNTCRSIIFETILKSLNKVNYDISSSGIEADNSFVSENTKIVLNKNNLYSIKEKSQNVSEFVNQRYDQLYVLEENCDITFPFEYRKKTVLSFSDPFGKDIEDYEKIFIEIKSFIEQKFEK